MEESYWASVHLEYYLAARSRLVDALVMQLVSVDLNSLGEFWAFLLELLISGQTLLAVMGFIRRGGPHQCT